MDAPESIIVNAEYHTKLLSTIAGLEYAPQARKDQIDYVKDLEQQVESGKAKISELAAKTKKERKEHEAIRDSIARRFAHFLVGKKEKFAQKASKEEREYVAALEHEMRERDTHNTRLQMYDEGKRVLEDLKAKEEVYQSAKAELQILYSKTFDGPTEAFPEDDRLEYAVIEATKKHEQVQARVNAESRAAELLARATKAMSNSQQNAREALGYSTYDVWGGGNLADYMERNALRSAEVYAHQAGLFVEQARRISPVIQPIPRVQIAQGGFLGDILFDNIFSDLAFHDKIRQSIDQLVLASERLTVERNSAVNRTELAGAELLVAAKDLETRRQELDVFRRTAFENHVAQHRPPPKYDVSMTSVPIVENPSTAERSSSTENDDEVDQFFQDLAASSAVATQSMRIQMPNPDRTSQVSPSTGVSIQLQMPTPTTSQIPPPTWGSRNPFAFAISEETRKLSE